MNDGKLTISRPHYAGRKEIISISVKDVDAKVTFLNIEIDLDNFTRCLTGLSSVDCKINPTNLDVVGKICERDELLIFLGEGASYRDKEVAKELLPEVTPEGWVASDYFGSQSSFYTVQRDDGEHEHWARTDMRRWLDRPVDEVKS